MTRNHFQSKALSSPLGSIDEEGDSILDESILDDSQSIDMAAPRFDAPQNQPFTTQPFLADDSSWHAFSSNHEATSFQPVNSQPAPTFIQSFQPHGQSGNLPHFPTFAEHHPAPWQPINIDTKSHLTLSDDINTHYDLKTEESHDTPIMPPPSGNAAEQFTFAPAMTSPQSENGWLSTSSTSETKKTPKREAITRQSFSTFPQHLRREGIRKKNARVEIPEGRTIGIIEEEIRLCDPNDEAKLKELKQFKRLLRNREAALSSRSRKKEHAKKLEDENKALAANFEKYDEMLRMKEDYWAREAHRLSQIIDSQVADKEDMVRRHTLETAELRKKISILNEEAQRNIDMAMSAVPSSAGFSNHTFSDFEHMTMSGSPQWDDVSFMNSRPVEDVKPQLNSLVVRQKDVRNGVKEEDTGVSGLLIMLLLCGAWVASGNNTRSNPVPQMPEDVRAASAQVLTNIYKDAGLQPESTPPSAFANPTLSGLNPSHHSLNAYSHHFDPQAAHTHLTAPSHQQECDQAFSLSADQYNHITTDWYHHQEHQHKPSSPPRRRNLADALSNLHLDKRTTATNAYTKSLLMDEVPTNIVRDFHRMVAENNGRRHSLQEPLN